MTPTLLLHCGCAIHFKDGGEPLCPAHGVQRVVRVLGMPPPRIRGMAKGPHVETVDLPAWTGRLVGSETQTHE